MFDYKLALIVIVSIFMVSILVLCTVVIVLNNNNRKSLEKLSLYQINTSSVIDSSIPEILNLIIQESFIDYQVKNVVANEGFINSERETEIRNDLVSLVTSRISNAVLDKLSLFYNIENIADIIADKIYITVMNFVANHNSQFVDHI